jgi:16S rRNA (guanine1516-N2)-methyltransferase
VSYSLHETPEGIALTLPSKVKWRAYRIDFLQGALRYRADHLQGRNELIAKAIGWKRDCSLHVFDTTAGLGREAFLLAALGCQVTLFERHPTISRLLKDGLCRAIQDEKLAPIIHRMVLNETCAIDYMQNANFNDAPDVIYCDPMFEATKKSALVKKEMQLLQTVVGEDADGQQLVALALQKAKKRVVVKRALLAPVLTDNPQLVLKARSHRFDIYLV